MVGIIWSVHFLLIKQHDHEVVNVYFMMGKECGCCVSTIYIFQVTMVTDYCHGNQNDILNR